MKAPESYLPRPLPEPLAPLVELALDLQWTWHHSGDRIWESIDPELWETTHNAWLVLHSVSDERLSELAEDPLFLDLLASEVEASVTQRNEATWFSERYDGEPFGTVAFFSMEFGITESLPIYSGGLGVLAGDFLKAAHDLGVPVVAVGLLYQQGYFHQGMTLDGEQLEFYPYNDPTMLPLSPLRDDSGEWIRVTVEFPGRAIRLRAWTATVGRCQLMLLDSNDSRNEPGDRGVTSELYGGDDEKRLEQELVLGIGGWRLLQKAGLSVSLCHLNEGHTGFAALERLREYCRAHQVGLDVARVALRPANIFTTHTPLPAGFDRFPVGLIRQYLTGFANDLGAPVDRIIQLGQSGDGGNGEAFNMAYLCVRLSGEITCVSRFHQDISRRILRPLFPRWPDCELPVRAITNGVHTPSWDSPEADRIWTEACGGKRWCGEMGELPGRIRQVDDAALWQMRASNRKRLLDFVRERIRFQVQRQGRQGPGPGFGLEDDVLTLGFARRFTAYKRPDLLLADPERFARLISNTNRPVQLVFSGKAHPRDTEGKALLSKWMAFMTRRDVAGRVVFLEDYDIRVAEMLVQGVDVWINTPRTSWEACGTSGMKVLVNGGLNVSQRDGWWAEAWTPGRGWAIGSGSLLVEDDDEEDAQALYDCLEEDVVPMFYDQDEDGLPRQWLNMVRTSMSELTADFSANRMLREYVVQCYGPAGQRSLLMNPDTARELAEGLVGLTQNWPFLRFGNLTVTCQEQSYHFVVQVHLGPIPPEWVAVELFIHSQESGERVVFPMERTTALLGASGGFNYVADVPRTQPAEDYTPRVIARDPSGLLRAPLDVSLIQWYC